MKINHIPIDLVLAGGSDKSIEVFDINKCQSSLLLTDAHARSLHQITQNSSEFNQQSFDIFLTTSIGDGIKLWDLRIAQCIYKYDSHNSRALATKIGVSPCSNYVFTGCDDRSVQIYDVRMHQICDKLTGFSDSVLSISCNPRRSEVLNF